MVTGDEVISDSYDLKVIDDTVYEIDCRKITLGADNIGPSFALVTCHTPRSGR